MNIPRDPEAHVMGGVEFELAVPVSAKHEAQTAEHVASPQDAFKVLQHVSPCTR